MRRPISQPDRAAALQRQLARLDRRIRALSARSLQLTRIRFAIVGVGIVMTLVATGWPAGVAWLVVALFAATFVLAVIVHRQIDGSLARHQGWLALKGEHLARLALDWDGVPPPLAVSAESRTPLEIDLNLVGPRSLHHLIDSAVSPGGRERLRGWLNTDAPDAADMARRRALIEELTPRPLLRDRLTLAARLASAGAGRWAGDDLLRWLADNSQAPSLRRWLVLQLALALLNWLLLALWLTDAIGPWWQASLLVYAVVTLIPSFGVLKELRDAFPLRNALEQLVAVFRRLETHNLAQTPALAALCAPVMGGDGEQRPSRVLRRVVRVVNATGIAQTPALGLLVNAVLPWTTIFAVLLQNEKGKLAGYLPGWLDVWSELEALSSLATFAYLNPQYTFATVEKGEALFSAESLGHPLIPAAEKVTNDFNLPTSGTIALFTGSNMAGKSTFLRTVAINLVLAYCGSVVNAAALTVAPLRLFTAIQVSDSVTDGVSYFYAEVRRLRALLDQLNDRSDLPLIYFIDEIFRGTNNRERLIGSRSLIRQMAGRNGVGLISTHDLELVHLADELPTVVNYHFREEIVDERMVFDYRLRLGPCPTTNALRIMQLAGLPVTG